jgi:hypothetical protein
MKKGGIGGASTQTGSVFEGENDLKTSLIEAGFKVKGKDVWHSDELIGFNVPKNALYSEFLHFRGVDHKDILSKRLLPDEAFFNIEKSTLFIIEKKFQNRAGSVDEKLQTCSFKLRQYKRLCSSLRIEVHFIYLLNDWFKKAEYKDTLEYVTESGCQYYFDELPLKVLGL